MFIEASNYSGEGVMAAAKAPNEVSSKESIKETAWGLTS
jgi:hypothetical protein